MVIIIFLFLIFVFCRPVLAYTDPLAVPNNRFGIHILEPEDIDSAAALVNSQGGDWGYVTLIIRQNDRNLDKWQSVFDHLRRKHLIPIVRLATYPEKNYWVKPDPNDVSNWVEFLNSLNWVVQNRYLILFNEPNHALEWGNDISPQEYVNIVKLFYEKLTQSSPDYFILPAGFDTAAPNSSTTMAASTYWQKMYQADPEVFRLFAGWNSHSYPNPDFSGLPTATGLGTIKSYLSELNYLSRFGLNPSLPVFVTETGWTHKDGNILGESDPPGEALSRFYQQAFTQIWIEPNLVAVTPFILNYAQPPFNQFSWQKPGSKEFYPHYYAIQSVPKISGRPKQLHSSQLVKFTLPQTLIDSSSYEFALFFKNTGQSIWEPNRFNLSVSGNFPDELIQINQIETTEPNQTLEIKFKLFTPEQKTSFLLGFQLVADNQKFGEKFEQVLDIVPPPNLMAKVKHWFNRPARGSGYRLLVYDETNQLITEFKLRFQNGLSQSISLYNLIPGSLYRFVLLKPYYLPRQVIIRLQAESNEVIFPPLIKLDFNLDQKFSFKDLFYFWRWFTT